MLTDNDPVAELQSQEIKSRFQTYEARKAKYLANSAEFLRSQVQPGYTPTYQADGAYIVPTAAVEEKETGWHVWFVNLDQAQSVVSITLTVSREGFDDTVLTASGLDASKPVADFLTDVVSGFGAASPLVVEKHCDTCVVIKTDDSSVVSGVTASVS